MQSAAQICCHWPGRSHSTDGGSIDNLVVGATVQSAGSTDSVGHDRPLPCGTDWHAFVSGTATQAVCGRNLWPHSSSDVQDVLGQNQQVPALVSVVLGPVDHDSHCFYLRSS
jgi:hypothetical protein